jgi:hypothetical protein
MPNSRPLGVAAHAPIVSEVPRIRELRMSRAIVACRMIRVSRVLADTIANKSIPSLASVHRIHRVLSRSFARRQRPGAYGQPANQTFR